MDNETFKNPKSGRTIKFGSKTHKQLIKEGLDVPVIPEKKKKAKEIKEVKVKEVKNKIVTKKGTLQKKEKKDDKPVEINEDLLKGKMRELARDVAVSHADEFEGMSPEECFHHIQDIIMDEVQNNPNGNIATKMMKISDDLDSDSEYDSECDSDDEGDYDSDDNNIEESE